MNRWWMLPANCRETVAGDLEELWHRGTTTRWQWWRMAVSSVAACWIHRFRSGADRTPSDIPWTGDRVMRTVLQDLLYGSVANEVRHISRVPVLLVRGERRVSGPRPSLSATQGGSNRSTPPGAGP